MTYPPTIIGKFTPQPPEPEPPKYETLADVPPFVAVRDGSRLGDPNGYVTWRDEENHVITMHWHDLRPFRSVDTPPAVRVHSVLGPITAIQFGGEVQDG